MTKSPTIRLLLGLLFTLVAVTGFSFYSLHEVSKLRELQSQTIDLNRHDSLVLLRIQNDVNTLGLKLQELTERRDAPVAAYRAEFDMLQDDLRDALRADARFAPSVRAGEHTELAACLITFWKLSERVFSLARSGRESAARRVAAGPLSDQQMLLANQVSALLRANNEAEERADMKIANIYERADREIYFFWTATMAAIFVTTLYLIHSNRKLFSRLEMLSDQRRVLTARLFSVQEEVLRSVSRELHDEFGQILTAVSAMLARAERKGVPADSPLRTELSEVREITHNTLEKMRSLSQMLHPSILDDYGLAKGIEWYAGVFERQTGVKTKVLIKGPVTRITGAPATHCFRIVQEALTNAAKHSGSKSAEVELDFTADSLDISVRDFGRGLATQKKSDNPGLGLVAMHERAEMLSGVLKVSSTPETGTTIWLSMPLRSDDAVTEAPTGEKVTEVLVRQS
ncbi:MAG: sensor histidine kinase [Acidobacteriaceae bacterium]|nr:sensor histidine kinase [Acidobacteriaceae bacterium]